MHFRGKRGKVLIYKGTAQDNSVFGSQSAVKLLFVTP